MSRTEHYFDTFVVRNFRAFCLAEQRLCSAVKAGDEVALKEARLDALASGLNAAVPAWHLVDTAVVDRPPWLPAGIGSGRSDARKLAEELERKHCRMLRSAKPIADMTLLGDVVDAYKHAELSNQSRLVHSSKVTVVIGSGWGEMHYGEGNYGGVDQVIVLTESGTKKRALSAVLQNVVDMWRAAMGLAQEQMGQ